MSEVRLSKLTVHRTKDRGLGYQWSLQNDRLAVVALVALEADAVYIARCVNTSLDINADEDELDRAGQHGVSQGLHRAAGTMMEDAKSYFAAGDDTVANILRSRADRFRAQAQAEEPKPR